MEKSNHIDALNTLDVRLKYACENIFNNTLNLSYEDMVNLISEKIFNPELLNNNVDRKDIQHKLNEFKNAYNNLKHKLSHKTRDNWEDSFEHQKEVVYLYLLWTVKPDFELVLTLLEHDTVEDTNATISSMRETYDDAIVFPVALMTKKPFYSYIPIESEDHEIFTIIQKSWILNSKMTLNDKFNFKKRFKNGSLSQEEAHAYQLYERLRKKYKKARNNDYCSKMKSRQSVLENAIEVNKAEYFYLSDEELLELSLRAVIWKWRDRFHGILTLKNCDIEKINRKIEETEKYFKDILSEFIPELWELIEYYLQKIKAYIIENSTDKTRESVNYIVTHWKQHEFVF